MRMARVNITVPDELVSRAKGAGLNLSRVSAAALDAELDRVEKLAALRRHLQALDVELGPAPDAERAAARAWADRAFGPA